MGQRKNGRPNSKGGKRNSRAPAGGVASRLAMFEAAAKEAEGSASPAPVETSDRSDHPQQSLVHSETPETSPDPNCGLEDSASGAAQSDSGPDLEPQHSEGSGDPADTSPPVSSEGLVLPQKSKQRQLAVSTTLKSTELHQHEPEPEPEPEAEPKAVADTLSVIEGNIEGDAPLDAAEYTRTAPVADEASTPRMKPRIVTIIPRGPVELDSAAPHTPPHTTTEEIRPETLEDRPTPDDTVDEDSFVGDIDPDTYFSGSDDEVIDSSTEISEATHHQLVSPVIMSPPLYQKSHVRQISVDEHISDESYSKPKVINLEQGSGAADKLTEPIVQEATGGEPLEAVESSVLPAVIAPAAEETGPTREPSEQDVPLPRIREPSLSKLYRSYESDSSNTVSPKRPESVVAPLSAATATMKLTGPAPGSPDMDAVPGEKVPAISETDTAKPRATQMESKQKQQHGPKPKSSASISAKNARSKSLIAGVCVVGFHHSRGPEVEYWVGPDGDQSETWPNLPFQSMPDGSHSFEENLCYFTLLYDPSTKSAPNPTPKRDDEGHIIEHTDYSKVETLFGISCTRQVSSSLLKNRPNEVTRSNVQKSVVVIARKPIFGPIKEKLTVVTRSYFEQLDFEDRSIIENLYENLVYVSQTPMSEGDFQVGTSLREVVYHMSQNVLVLLKAFLLEKKVLFHSTDTDKLCTTQFAILSLIPDLPNNLDDCGSPMLSSYETRLYKPTHLKTADRTSLLKFMGLPLQLFAAGGFFNPFVPLQQFDELKHPETQYGVFGSTNRVFLTSGVDWDVLVDVDTSTVKILTKSLKPLLQLTAADRKFIQPIYDAVLRSWDSSNTWQPSSLGYDGSEDFIRHKFEDYIMSLLASVKYDSYVSRLGPNPPEILKREYPVDPLSAFNASWAKEWRLSNNYRIFQKFTDDELFDVVAPVHIGLAPPGENLETSSAALPSRLNGEAGPKPDDKTSGFLGLFRWTKPPGSPVIITNETVDAKPEGTPSGAGVVVTSETSQSPDNAEPKAGDSTWRPKNLFSWSSSS